MTTTFNTLLALLLLLASGTGQALADQPPPAHPEVIAQATENIETDKAESPDRIAWQRVGSPIREV